MHPDGRGSCSSGSLSFLFRENMNKLKKNSTQKLYKKPGVFYRIFKLKA
jgi:hypothetical protein